MAIFVATDRQDSEENLDGEDDDQDLWSSGFPITWNKLFIKNF